MTKFRLFTTIILGITFSFPAAAKLYKWVDDRGVTHYGETIPPEYADKDRSELNKSGRVIDSKDVLSPEEIRAQRASMADEEAKKREELESKRRDTMLVNTYSSVEEIELARKRNVKQIELRINGISSQINIVENQLLRLQNEVDSYSKANRKIPPSLEDDLQTAKERLEKLNGDLEQPVSEKAALDARYDSDKARYKQLTGK